MKRSRKHTATSEVIWSEWIAEARTLLDVSPERLTLEQKDRLDAISDALIHLVGHAESVERDVPSEAGARVPKILWRDDAPSGRELTNVEKTTLRGRILAGLQATQLRVREAPNVPYERAMDSPRVASAELLGGLETVHRAILIPGLAIAAGAGRELWDIECSTTIDLPEDIPRGRYVALRVSGDSMEPLICSGDLVLVRIEDRAVAGTVIVARDPDHGYVVKEVGSLTAKSIELLSLNPLYPPFRVPLGRHTVLGTVVLRWPRG